MFTCKPCFDVKEPGGFFMPTSYGPCEWCRVTSDCADIGFYLSHPERTTPEEDALNARLKAAREVPKP